MTICKDHGRHRALHVVGYAKVWFAGKVVYLHRLIYCQANDLALADIAGCVIRHTCDNPRCIEPAHLLVGTQADNMQDAQKRGRIINPNRQLSDEDVLAIKQRYNPTRVGRSAPNGVRAIARDYNINSGSIHHILSGRSYKHKLQGAEGVKS